MKKFLLFISFCLLCLSQMSAATEVVEDFSTNIWNLDTSNQSESGSGTYTSTATGYTYNLSWTNSGYWNSNKYLLIGKGIGDYIELPAFTGTVTKIVINNSSGCSKSAAIKITDNAGTEIVASQTFSTTSSAYTYNIPADKQAAGQVLRLVISSKYNVQITKITITVEEGSADQVATPTTTATAKMLYGAEFTISTSTEGAYILYNLDGSESYTSVENNTVTLNAPTEGESFTIKAYAVDPTGTLPQSETLKKPVTLYAPTPAEAVFTNEAGEVVTGGDVKQGSYINYSWESGCSAKVYYNDVLSAEFATTDPSSGSWYVDAKKYAAGTEVTIKIEVTNKYNETSTATATFTVANPYKVVDVITVDDTGVTGTSYTSFSGKVKNGAEYAGRVSKNIGMQLNSNSNGLGSAIYMTQSVGKVTKIILNINTEKSNIAGKAYVFGKNTPYVAYSATGTTKPSTDEAYAYNSDESKIGKAIATEIAIQAEPYVIENPGYNYIIIVSNGAVVFNSITFEWEDAFEHGDDISYEMQNETSKLTEGKFVTLVDATNKIAVSRNNAAEGTIAGAAASVEVDTENNKTSLNLKKGQFSIDEFELVPAEGGFKLYGGGTITRRYIGVDATGLTTTADETAAAVVTLESDGTGVVVKFADGEIIVSDGTNFGKGTASTEAPASLDESATLVPAYVFVSPGKDSTGVEDIEVVETEAPAQYYNLNGVEVKAGNLVPGIYIVRQGNKVSKQFIR
ncbi:MAG: chitobiase/beta-hexosaminidase C-terminal domain-containing protein [Muribaculaceae bacterium]